MSSHEILVVSNAIPQQKTKYSAGYDLPVTEELTAKPFGIVRTELDLKLKMPLNIYAQIRIRSSVAEQWEVLGGLIDPDYRETIFLKLRNISETDQTIRKGECPAQITFHERCAPLLKGVPAFNKARLDRPRKLCAPPTAAPEEPTEEGVNAIVIAEEL